GLHQPAPCADRLEAHFSVLARDLIGVTPARQGKGFLLVPGAIGESLERKFGLGGGDELAAALEAAAESQTREYGNQASDGHGQAPGSSHPSASVLPGEAEPRCSA